MCLIVERCAFMLLALISFYKISVLLLASQQVSKANGSKRTPTQYPVDGLRRRAIVISKKLPKMYLIGQSVIFHLISDQLIPTKVPAKCTRLEMIR